ncbi:sulfatase family protein [Desertivirga arenae]|uniref:sulfatase family protein n=1 Tax=Desertivirga arenae TaxID=2810309 RepID=UPI001A979F25|nr:sulfatase [Pedobacter sp. SYSU D00823]
MAVADRIFKAVSVSVTTLFFCLPGIISAQNKETKHPNILFCIADDASLEFFSAYGFGYSYVNTPAFDRIAREGILFENAYTPNAKCSPSRASILTGWNPWQLEEAANHNSYFPAKFASFVEVLGQNGYTTAFTGKGWGPGVAVDGNGKQRQLTGKAYSEIKVQTPTDKISPINYAANFEKFLQEKPSDKPFCFWYGGHEPHRAYEYGSGISKGKKDISQVKVPPTWPDNAQVRNDLLDYAYEVEYFDQYLGKILDLLEKSGELDNTIIVVTSDNGMPFPRVKGHVYEKANHLPLAIYWKNGIKSPGRKVKDFVSFIDFAPTFLELAGVDQSSSGMQAIEGKSILNLLKSSIPDKNRDHVLLGRERTDIGRPNDEGYPVRAIIKDGYFLAVNYEPSRWPCGNPETGYRDTDGSPTKTSILQAHRKNENDEYWKLSFAKKGGEELYDIKKDPFCLNNLAASSAQTSLKQKLKQQLEAELRKQNDPRMFGKGYLFDQYKYAQPDVVGYYEKYLRGEIVKTGSANESDLDKAIK